MTKKRFRSSPAGARGAGLAIMGLLLLPLYAGAETVPLDYAALPNLVRSANGAVQSGILRQRAAEMKTGHLRRSFLPVATAKGGYEAFTTGPYGRREQPYGEIEARINLAGGGRDRVEEMIHRAGVESAAAQTEVTYRDSLAAARRLYWELVFSHEMIALLEDVLKRNERTLEEANRRIRRGLATETDRLELEMITLQHREDIESFHHEITLIEMALCPLIGAEVGTRFRTPAAIDHDHKSDVEVRDIGVSPEMRLLGADRDTAMLQAQASRRANHPSLDLYGGYYLHTLRERDYLDRSLRDDTAIGLQASLPLFDGLRSRRATESFAAQGEAFERELVYAREIRNANALILRKEMNHLDDMVHSSEDRVRVAERYLRNTLDEYARGVKNAPDVIAAIERHLAHKRQYSERKRDFELARVALEKFVGR